MIHAGHTPTAAPRPRGDTYDPGQHLRNLPPARHPHHHRPATRQDAIHGAELQPLRTPAPAESPRSRARSGGATPADRTATNPVLNRLADATCPRCRQPAITTPGGHLLEPRRHNLGLHRPDGTSLTQTDYEVGERAHRSHLCPAQALRRSQTLMPARS